MSDQEHHLRTLIQTLERENADLRAKLARLDGLTNWVCSCGGTDCKGQEENAALRNEVNEQARLNGKGAERELALRAKVETLERGNAALRADKERLDWLSTALGGYWACEHFEHRNRISRTYIDAGMADNPTPAELKGR